MIMKGRSPTLRHVPRTHRAALDWLFGRINLEPKIHIRYVDTKNPLADMPTKESFTRGECNHLLRLFDMRSFLMVSCSRFSNFLSVPIGKQSAMSKRDQEPTSQWRFTDGETKTNFSSESETRQLGVTQPVEREGQSSAGFGISRQSRECRWRTKIIILVQGDLLGPPIAQKSNVLKWGDRKMLNSVSWKQERPGGIFELYG